MFRNLRCDYRTPPVPVTRDRAGNGTRTRDINLGKVALYQLSYSRIGRENIRKKHKRYKNEPYSNAIRGKYTAGLRQSQGAFPGGVGKRGAWLSGGFWDTSG